MLRSIEAEFVKLDRSIVTSAPTEPGARAVLMAMATFAHQTGAFVIAEGIETEAQLAFLLAHQCAEGQGYLFSKPLAAEPMARLLQAGIAEAIVH